MSEIKNKRPRGEKDNGISTTPNKKPKVKVNDNVSLSNKKVVTRSNEDNDKAIGPFSSKAKTTPLTPPPSSSRSSSSSQKLHITSSSTVPLSNGKLNRQQVVPVAPSAIHAQPSSSSSSGMRGKKHTIHEEQKEEFITISETDKPVGPFTSKTPIKPRDKFSHRSSSDLRSDLISSRSEEEETLVEVDNCMKPIKTFNLS